MLPLVLAILKSPSHSSFLQHSLSSKELLFCGDSHQRLLFKQTKQDMRYSAISTNQTTKPLSKIKKKTHPSLPLCFCAGTVEKWLLLARKWRDDLLLLQSRDLHRYLLLGLRMVYLGIRAIPFPESWIRPKGKPAFLMFLETNETLSFTIERGEFTLTRQ